MSREGTAITNNTRPLDGQGSAGSTLHNAIRGGSSFSGRERNCIFLNLRDGRFADISPVSGLDFPDDGRAVARVDWDQDGDLDFWIINRSGPQIRFLRNDVPQENNFLAFRLQGSTCNRDAIGARAELYIEGQAVPLIRTVSAGDGFLAQSSKTVHFGLGKASKIDRLVVRWPGGENEVFTGLEVNGHYEIVQDSGQATLRQPRASLTLQSSVLEKPQATDHARVLSMSQLPLPWLDYMGFDGRRRAVGKSNGSGTSQGILLNLWSSSCPHCLAEIKEWTSHADKLRATGIRVVSISVDGLDGDLAKAAMASQKIIAQIGFPFESGLATARTVEKLQMVNNHLFDVHHRLPAPSSFLIDPRGKLASIYKGRVTVKQLLADLKRVQSESSSKLSIFPGRWINQKAAHNPFRLVWRMLETGLLEESLEYIQHNEPLLAKHLEYPNLLALAGNGQLSRGKPQQAAELYRKALKITPNYIDAQNNLAWLLATNSGDQIRNGVEALLLAEAVVQKQGQIPSYLDTLAAAYAEVGRFPEAIATAKKAIQLAKSQGNTAIATDIHTRLQKYLSGKPWRDK